MENMDSSEWIIFDQHNVITWLNVASVATIFNIKACIKNASNWH